MYVCARIPRDFRSFSKIEVVVRSLVPSTIEAFLCILVSGCHEVLPYFSVGVSSQAEADDGTLRFRLSCKIWLTAVLTVDSSSDLLFQAWSACPVQA